jgi:transcriptional repressor NrdR
MELSKIAYKYITSYMLCPKCKHPDSKVLDSRPANTYTKRRRQCEKCGFRFTTMEEIKIFDLVVEKRSRKKELFSEQKLETGIRKSFNKRNIDDEKITLLMQTAIDKILALDVSPVSSIEIGKITLEVLKSIDEAAFVCYWAMFGNFSTIDDFKNLLN